MKLRYTGTDRTIINNRPDIVLTNKTLKHTYVIEINTPNDNITNKQLEKIEKYIPLSQEIKTLWKLNTVTIVPFIISATGITPKTFKPNLSLLQLPTYIHTNIQKAVILKTCSIVRQCVWKKVYSYLRFME